MINAVEPSKKEWTYSNIQIGKKDTCCDFWFRTNAGKKFGKVNPVNYLANITLDWIYHYNPTNNFGLQVHIS